MPEYVTNDLWIAATLVTLNFSLIDIDKSNPRSMKFVFKDSPAIDDIVNEYWAKKLSVDPLTLFSNWRNLRYRMMSN